MLSTSFSRNGAVPFIALDGRRCAGLVTVNSDFIVECCLCVGCCYNCSGDGAGSFATGRCLRIYNCSYGSSGVLNGMCGTGGHLLHSELVSVGGCESRRKRREGVCGIAYGWLC